MRSPRPDDDRQAPPFPPCGGGPPPGLGPDRHEIAGMNESAQAASPADPGTGAKSFFVPPPHEGRRLAPPGLTRSLLRNLRGGLLLALFRRLDPGELHATPSAFAALALCDLALHLACAYAAVGPTGEFEPYYLAGNLLHLPLLLFAGLCLARLARRDGLLLALPVACLAVGLPLDLLAALLSGAWVQGWFEGAWAAFSFDHYYPLFGWWALACLAATLRWSGPAGLRRLGAALLFAGLLGLPLWNLPREELWVPPYEEADTAGAPRPASEETLYAQPALLEAALGRLLPGRPGTEDLYFVGFAGDGGQDVFLHEVEAVERLFRERFDTAGRSVLLANSPRTTLDYPFASATALQRTLERVAAAMDREEDVLFLFLTSHGSEDHRLLTDLWPLELRQIDPPLLRQLLDEAGVRWRVVVVSACYAGGFIEPLQDEGTIVMTAADAVSTSFGCSEGAGFTWFGQALFDEELRRSHSFVGAFERAAASIERREREEGETPSHPQLFVGDAIRDRLPGLEARLEKLCPSAGAAAPNQVVSRSE